jgi:hypothetical protein
MDKPKNVSIYETLYRNVKKKFYNADVTISLNIDDRSILNLPAVELCCRLSPSSLVWPLGLLALVSVINNLFVPSVHKSHIQVPLQLLHKS